MNRSSKRFKKLIEPSVDNKALPIEDAIKKIKKNCTTKFDESIDVSYMLNLKNKKEEFNLRTIVNLPNGNGKKVKVAVFAKGEKIKEAEDAGADIVGGEELLEKIKDGKIIDGIATYSGGAEYFGKFKNGDFHGQGRFYCAGEYNYKGEFKNGKFYGKGRMEYDNGEIFEGHFKNDRKTFGKWKFSDGNEYEGEVKNDTAHGKGK